MRTGLTPIIIVFVLHHLQNQMMRPYVPLYAASLDIGYFGVGLVAAAAALLPMFFALPFGSLADRWGSRPMVIVGSILSGAAYLVLWGAPNIFVIVGSQIVAGLANLLIILASQSYVGSLGRGLAAERNFGTYTLFASIGQILGPLLGGVLISFIGFSGSFLTASSLSTLCLAAALILLPKPVRRESATVTVALPRRALGYLRSPMTRLAILVSCLMSVPEILRTSFLPIYLGDVIELDPAYVGYVLAVFSVAGLFAKTVLPRIVLRFGRQVLLFWITTLCAITVAVLPIWPSLAVVAVITVCMGLTFGLGRPLSMAMAANSSEPGDMGLVVGLRIAGNRAADFVLPIGFGAAAAVGGIAVAFFSGAGLMLIGAAFLVAPMVRELRNRRRNEFDE